MGVFTQVEVIVIFDDQDKASEFAEIINDFENEVKKRRLADGDDSPFSCNIDSINSDDANVYIKLSSERYSNAEFQAEWVSNIAKEFKENVVEFTAEVTQPESIIWWRGEDEEDEEDEE